MSKKKINLIFKTTLAILKNQVIKLLRFISPQKIINKEDFTFTLKVHQSDIQYIIRTNVVLKIRVDDKFVFFRHCFPHSSLKKYVLYFIEYYFKYVAKNDFDIEKIIKNSLSINKNYKKFIRMGSWKNKDNPAGKYVGSGYDAMIVGICCSDPNLNERIKDFVKFSSAMLDYWKMNHWFGSRANHNQTYHANLEFAYHRIAKLFKIDSYLLNVWYGFLRIGDDLFFGYFMDEAPGVLANSIPKNDRKQLISPNFQKTLSDISLLDYICSIYDHAPYNYNLTFNHEGIIEKTFFFDNNEGGGFAILSRAPKHFSPLISGYKLNRPFVSKELVNTLSTIRKKDVVCALEYYLVKPKIDSVWKRIKKLRKALEYTKDNDPEKIINSNRWCQNTIREELNSDIYGRTYLHWFLGIWR